jgi:hypothetical protein
VESNGSSTSTKHYYVLARESRWDTPHKVTPDPIVFLHDARKIRDRRAATPPLVIVWIEDEEGNVIP